MASSSSSSSSSASELDELRGALASRGLVLKDSILARVARSKSLKGLVVPSETTTTPPGTLLLQTHGDGAPEPTQDTEGLELDTKLRNLVDGQSKAEEAPDGQALEEEGREKKPSVVNDGDGESVEKKDGDGKRDISTKSGGLPSSEDEKLKMRAARFGTVNNDSKEEEEKKRARAARFGIPDEDAKKKARIERFSKSLVEDPEEMEKRKARAARFAIVANEN